MFTLGSLFDGIGGWLLAATRNGIKPVWSSEIEDFPMKVSKAHFPDVEQLGDVTKINEGLPDSTLKAKGGVYGGGSENYVAETNLKQGKMLARKLTPLECERLQELPDNYTAYGSDTARYKAIGNGMAQPCADFILSKVVEMFEEADDET